MKQVGADEYGFDSAVMMMRMGRYDDASKLLWNVVRTNPLHGDAWDMRARILAESGRHEDALINQGFALQAYPHRFDFWHNKGMIEASCHLYQQAETSFTKSIGLKETWEGLFNLGNVLCNQMKIEQALTHYERAFELDTTDNAQLRVNYGECLMAVGRWKEGFTHYRHRFNSPGFPPAPRNKYPLWRGEDLTGKTILLYSEQGFGDEIQSLRFAQPVMNMGAKVIIAVRPPMYRLVRTDNEFFHGLNFFADGIQHDPVIMLMHDKPPFEPDYTCALLDVPAFVELSPETVPQRNGYIRPPERGFRLDMPTGLNVGVCWASGKRELQPHIADTAAAKSLSFKQLVEPLAGYPGINLFSLQQIHNDDAAMREIGMRDPMPGVTDFADTAFIIDHLDLVITVDTSVAHLAGAMGKSVWNLVRHDAIWPWMKDNGHTCWYSSMNIYRQERPFDWSAPLRRLKQDFMAYADRQAA